MSVRLTVAQAIVRFLEAQYVERDGVETPFFAGCWGIFGHGNVAGVGQALLEREHAANDGAAQHVLRYHQARNEQAMVHAAVGYARHRDRLAAFACTRLGRARLDQHGHRRRAGHDQPDPGAAAARRRLRHPGRQPGAAGARGPRARST